MRIGINGTFWQWPGTGSGQYVRHLLPALAALDSENEYSLFLPQDQGSGGDAATPWQEIPASDPFSRRGGNLAKVWFEQIAYPRACARHGVDLAHVPYFAPPLRPSVPTVVTIHDLIPFRLREYMPSSSVRLYMRVVARAAREAQLVLTDSLASARDIREILGIPEDCIRVIYLAADRSYRPLTADERRPVLDRLGLPPRYLLYLGGFDRRKNVPLLLRAMAQARGELDADLVIAGRPPERDTPIAPDPRPIIAELGLADRVHLTGWVVEEDKPALYAGALGFVWPSQYEGFGLPALEAIACGTPAIVAGGSSLEEVVGPGGIVVPVDDADALAEAMVRLANDGALRRELSAAGLAHAVSFSWERTARETLVAYDEARSRERISTRYRLGRRVVSMPPVGRDRT